MRLNTSLDTSAIGLLRLTRVSVYTALLFSFFFFFQGDFASWLQLMPLSAWSPVGVTSFMHPLVLLLKAPATAWIGYLISFLFLASTLACVVGWQWRISSLTTLILSLVTFGLKNSFGHAFRSESILILAQFILVLAPFAPGKSVASSFLPDSKWTLQLLRFLWISMFFLGALNKLRFSGWAWASENFLQDYLLANQITRAGTLADRPLATFAQTLISAPVVTLGLSYFVLLFELLYPLILFKRLKVPILVGTVFFQLATFTLLGVNFLFYLPLLPIWLTEKEAQ